MGGKSAPKQDPEVQAMQKKQLEDAEAERDQLKAEKEAKADARKRSLRGRMSLIGTEGGAKGSLLGTKSKLGGTK